MAIDFDKSRWNKLKEDHRAWWAGDLKRPILQMSVGGNDPGRPEPSIPSHHFTAFYDLSIPAEDVVDRWDYDLSGAKFIGDGFPSAFPNFGPGSAAAYMGAKLIPSPETYTVWFESHEIEIKNLHLNYKSGCVWYKRLLDICKAATERWQGQVQVGMTDIGGSLDVISSFRKGEKLLLDLYDYPEEVKRVNWELHEAWWKYYDEINSVMQPVNPGYSAWAAMYSEVPYYMLQCDFCYMIGPDMFDEFIKPELSASCKRLGNAFYHLDGPGQLPHLDSLLSIPDLKGIQWVPGAGVPSFEHWPEVYKKIRNAGKLVQVYGGLGTLDALNDQLGTLEGIYFIGWVQSEEEALECVRKYG